MNRRIIAGLVLSACIAEHAAARVERIEIVSRQPFAGGAAFGDTGAYEKLRGRAFFALDPNAVANAPIADLKLAPRNARGLVEFGADFLVLRPVDAARGNGTMLYEVNNRGSIGILRQINEALSGRNDPATAADAGNGFLFRRGFTLVWSAWAADVATTPGDGRMVLDAPVATEDGTPITGKVAYDLLVNVPLSTARFTGNFGTAYPPAQAGAPDALLTERDRPDGERRLIPRSAALAGEASGRRGDSIVRAPNTRPEPGSSARAGWSFVAAAGDRPATEIRLEGGFKPGRIYQLVYAARDPNVLALGMAGIRDLLSHLRSHPLAGVPPPGKNLIFGISQSGRLIQTMLWRGLHVDEDGRPVFDGAFIHVAGGGKGGFDYRFAMPTRHFSVLEDHIYPTDFFPFATVTARDPVTGAEGSVLDKARALGVVPKLFYVNNSSEYWNRAASLITTDPQGSRDLPPAPEARIYLIAGAQHYVGVQLERGMFTSCVNTLNHYRAMRALLLALERWVRDGVEPPPSAYPRIADGTLVTVAAFKQAFPRIPAFRLPETNLRPPRLNLGKRFESERIADEVPPIIGQPFEALVPRTDADGNDQGGIALPEMLAPLGTRTGFNTRADAVGFPWATGRWDGSFVPFPRNEAERRASGDPRRSLQARYAGRADYEAKVRAAAAVVVGQGYLLAEDVGALVTEAGGLYHRIMAHDPADPSCRYLFGR
jgi:Alpha/beta hydrolase domain